MARHATDESPALLSLVPFAAAAVPLDRLFGG